MGTSTHGLRRLPGLVLTALAAIVPAAAAEPSPRPSARQVTEWLHARDPAAPPLELAGRDLSRLDLSGLDFKAARLPRADLFGTDLTGADLSRTDLRGARLDRAVIIAADFSGADLSGATLMRPNVTSTLAYRAAEAPRFTAANMTGIRITTRLEGASLAGADLTASRLGPHEPRADLSTMPHTSLIRCDIRAARFRNADLSRVDFTFSNLRGADFTGANLAGANFSRTDLSGADFTGADVTGTDFEGADLSGAIGLETARGTAAALNLDKVTRR